MHQSLTRHRVRNKKRGVGVLGSSSQCGLAPLPTFGHATHMDQLKDIERVWGLSLRPQWESLKDFESVESLIRRKKLWTCSGFFFGLEEERRP